MSAAQIIQCTCGVKLRVPQEQAGQAMRCPKCKAMINSSGDATETAPGARTPVTPGTICPICQTGIGAHESYFPCPKCSLFHHKECWDEIGGCSTYGCKAAPVVEKEAPSVPLSAWGDDKVCPVCGEKIKAIALKCRYCSATFDTVDPLNANDVRGKVNKDASEQTLRVITVVVFVFSVAGVVAPIMAVVSLVWVWMKRDALRKAGPVFLILGYCSVGLSLLYSLLMLLFLIF